jgi:hypothetical protein
VSFGLLPLGARSSRLVRAGPPDVAPRDLLAQSEVDPTSSACERFFLQRATFRRRVHSRRCLLPPFLREDFPRHRGESSWATTV